MKKKKIFFTTGSVCTDSVQYGNYQFKNHCFYYSEAMVLKDTIRLCIS